MRKLAIDGGAPLVRKPIKPLNTVTEKQMYSVLQFMENAKHGRVTLSGYLAGSERGGSAVQRLEQIWCQEFGVRHAVAVNSGTSAILAACIAVGVGPGRRVFVPAMAMSAAVAVPLFLGAEVVFVDIDKFFCLIAPQLSKDETVIAVNLFGHPAELYSLRQACDQASAFLIEDACQSPWATEDGVYAGTIGHIGAFSFNVHKFIQAGEGGMAVTNDDDLAYRMRMAANHGEMNERKTQGFVADTKGGK